MGEGLEADLDPPRSYRFEGVGGPLDGVFAVSQTFVEFEAEGSVQRWGSYEHHGNRVPVSWSATSALLEIADQTWSEGIMDLHGDLKMHGFQVSRWQLVSAPRRIELDDRLRADLILL